MTNELILDNTPIKTDRESRFCLNDLHKAAGESKTHQPSNFMRRVETYALIAEIANSSHLRNYEPVNLVIGGTSPGIFALIAEITSSANSQTYEP